jgi:hypothetical protein
MTKTRSKKQDGFYAIQTRVSLKLTSSLLQTEGEETNPGADARETGSVYF